MLYVKRGIMTEELCSRYIKNKTLHCYIINSLQEQGYYSPQVCNDPFFLLAQWETKESMCSPDVVFISKGQVGIKNKQLIQNLWVWINKTIMEKLVDKTDQWRQTQNRLLCDTAALVITMTHLKPPSPPPESLCGQQKDPPASY